MNSKLLNWVMFKNGNTANIIQQGFELCLKAKRKAG